MAGPDDVVVASDVRELLRDEYMKLQDIIESFDERVLTIKAWSVSFSFAAIGAAYAADGWPVLMLAGLSALLFWCIEGLWKTFQDAHYGRLYVLEDYFAGNSPPPAPLQIGRSWYARWKAGRNRKLLRVMTWPHVWLPHGVACLLALVLLVLHFLGIVPV